MAVMTLNLKALQTLIERIRRMLDPAAILSEDMLQETFLEYEEAIGETNERLRECDDLLRDGHRAQAIQRSEQEPDLLQVVAILDFAERPLWHAMLQEAGHAPPAAVLLDVAAELNEAYNLEKPLTDLMRMHRLHALAGSPLKTRLGFLRMIAQRDAGNVNWQEDLRQYERARQLQIEQELIEAERARDASLAAQLQREVTGDDWQDPPAAALLENAARIHVQLRQAHARQRIKELAVQLHECYGAKDDLSEAKARSLRQTWNGQVALAQLSAEDPIYDQVEPVFDWLDKLEARRQRDRDHKAAIVALEQALDAGAKRIELESCYNAVTRSGAVPEELDRKVQLRVELLERRGRLRLMAGVTVTLALIVCAALGVTFYVRHLNSRAEFARQVASLEQLVTEGKLAEADQYLQQLEEKAPGSFAAPEIQKLAGDIAALHRKEQTRLEAWERTAGVIRAALEDGSWGKLEQALLDVREARRLSQTDVERLEVNNLEGQLREGIAAHQKVKDEEFAALKQALGEEVNAVSGDDRTQVAELKARAEVLAAMPRVSLELRQQVQPLIARLDTLTSSADSRQKEMRALARINSSLGNMPQYIAALEAYVQEFPQTARAAVFTRVLQSEQPIWQGVEASNALLGKWSTIDFRGVDPMQAKELMDEGAAHVAMLADFPAAAAVTELVPYLEAVQRRVDDAGNRVHKELLVVLEDPRVVSVSMLLTTDGKRYYFDGEDKPPREDNNRPGEWIIFAFVDPTLQELKRHVVPGRTIKNPPGATGFDWTSPQRRFRERAIEVTDALKDANWESSFVKLLAQLGQEEDMEPTLRLHLTQLIFNVGCQGSHCLAQGFKPQMEILAGTMVDIESNWIEPDDALGKRSRLSAKETLARILKPESPEEFKACTAAAAEHFGRLQKRSRGKQYQWVGCLLKDSQAKWTPALRLTPKDSGELVTFVRNASGALEVQRIGSVQAGAATIDEAAQEVLVEGRPVYLSAGST